MTSGVTLRFLGAAGTVTGSKYLVSYQGANLLVDCGLFQGLKSLRLKNWSEFQIQPAKVQAVVLTHAHIDHSGYLPRFIQNGFSGPVYSTAATLALCQILLPDSGRLMEEEAEYLNRRKRSKHSPALPLFSEREAIQSLEKFVTKPFRQVFEIDKKFKVEFRYAGHILGAASAVVEVGGRRIIFTGDIGRPNDEVLFGPEPLPHCDYLITESTYGNRLHAVTDNLAELEKVINETWRRQGVIIIPSFAVGRAQSLLYYLWRLRKEKRIPDFPMYLNSPMAENVTSLLCQFRDLHRLSETDCAEVGNVVEYVRSVEESIELNKKKGPMLIISASGMLTGGRVLHHVKAFGQDPKNTILFSGFQAAGTRGEALLQGNREIKILGEYVNVRAQIVALESMSAHADFQEIIQWFSQSKVSPKKVFITHGEASAADNLRRRLTEVFQWKCVIPEQDQAVELE